MRFRRRNYVVSLHRFFWFTAFAVSFFVLFSGFSFSSFRFLFGEKFQPVLSFARKASTVNAAVSDDFPVTEVLSIRETVLLPDQVVLFLNYPRYARLFTKEELDCVYLPARNSTTSSEARLKLSPARVEAERLGEQIVRCPTGPRGLIVTVGSEPSGVLPPGPTHRWNSLAYEALVDNDNTTVVFVKGINLRPDRVSNASRFECVYGWDLSWSKLLVRSEVLSIAQEIVRCRTPLSVLISQQKVNGSVRVSVRIKGRGILPSVARLGFLSDSGHYLVPTRKPHEMCVCTMARNQARFLKEWVMYHAEIGVQRWYIYDNNSDDDTDKLIESLFDAGYNISRHIWPWVKTQEGGFSHCALQSRDSCEWVGFIDVDEFFHLPSGLLLHDVIQNLTSFETRSKNIPIGEIRVSCHSFGPSGLKQMPQQGVTVGYTCRIMFPERHKSIIRPEALNSTLINIVHHFHLRDRFRFIDVDRKMLVVNHYKYQVWEVFKEKFYRRVATYVADWKDDHNVGSKDRAPGLGTKPVEPNDWSSRFCEVTDTGLKDMVLHNFADPKNSLLPWQTVDNEITRLL
ncbi:glycosyltransferase family 92 protein RCOM_0530710-like [Hibiscus syriacus]|uniref:glycosyltransferase family 92 protein RCOM_0530710-like n=1 Tax=Hibiscus syriacus TaxID=106335 RepID=UPI0019239A8B|nr:glycosyltransferase family 92 protein RCOM_0530710-like [Hibiscus syriacus]